MSDWIYDLSLEEAEKAWALNGHRQLDRADLETAMRAAVERVTDKTICAICRQVAARPDLRGTMWRRSGGGIAMSFSAAVVQLAGGLDRLLSEWIQVDPNTGVPLK